MFCLSLFCLLCLQYDFDCRFGVLLLFVDGGLVVLVWVGEVVGLWLVVACLEYLFCC